MYTATHGPTITFPPTLTLSSSPQATTPSPPPHKQPKFPPSSPSPPHPPTSNQISLPPLLLPSTSNQSSLPPLLPPPPPPHKQSQFSPSSPSPTPTPPQAKVGGTSWNETQTDCVYNVSCDKYNHLYHSNDFKGQLHKETLLSRSSSYCKDKTSHLPTLCARDSRLLLQVTPLN